MSRNKKKKSRAPSRPHNIPRPPTVDDGLVELNIQKVLSKARRALDAAGTTPSLTPTGEPAPNAVQNRKGFLDLPGEIRNAIYHMIGDQLPEDEPRKSHLGMIRDQIQYKYPSDYAWRTLAMGDTNRQIRHEFLTLLVFDDLISNEFAARDVAIHGPRALSNLHILPEFHISTNIRVNAVLCDSTDGHQNIGKKRRCELRLGVNRTDIILSARYYVGERDYFWSGIEKDIRASFIVTLNERDEFTQESRSLIEFTLANVFQANENINIESLVLATQRVMALDLDILQIKPRYWRSFSQEIQFEFSRAAFGSTPEFRATPRKNLRVALLSSMPERTRLTEERYWRMTGKGSQV